MKFSEFKCWDKSPLEDVYPPQAHIQREDYFLATHSPFKNFRVLKSKVSNQIETEEKFFEAVSDKDTDFELAFVKGSPGTGKSHLIRWLYEEWRRWYPDDKAIFIPRRDATLQGTLEKLIAGLQSEDNEFDDLAEKLKTAAFGLNQRGMGNKLVDSLALVLDEEGLEENYDGIEHVSNSRFVHVLRNPSVRHFLCDDGNIVDRIVKKLIAGDDENSEIDYNIAEFTTNDLVRLFNHCDPRLDVGTSKAFGRVIGDDVSLEDLRITINARLGLAQQEVVGIQPRGLLNIISELRRRLYPKRLVLLIEDVSCFQGVDQQLMEAIIDPGEFSSQNAKLISIVGITSQYYNQQINPRANIIDRMTYVIDLSDSDENVDRVSILLSDEVSLQNFSALYLNASRLSSDEVGSWYKDQEGGKQGPPNACEKCAQKNICHIAFGAIDGIGLFPLNKQFLVNASKSVLTQGQEIQERSATPRTFIGYLRYVLSEANSGSNSFLSKELIDRKLDISALGNLSINDDSFVDVHGGEFSEQLKILIRLWGDGTTEVTPRAQDEALFSNLTQELFDIFELPFLSEKKGKGKGGEKNVPPVDAPTPNTPAPDAPTPDTPDPENPVSIARRQFQADIENWVNGNPLEDDQVIRGDLARFLKDHLPWDEMGIPRPLWNFNFSERAIAIEGQRTNNPNPIVMFDRDRLTAYSLTALWEINNSPDSGNYFENLTQLTKLSRKYQSQISDSFSPFVGYVESEPDSLFGNAMDILVLNSIINGKMKFGLSDAQVVNFCLSGEEANEESGLFGEWRETKNYLNEFREELVKFVVDWCQRGLIDAGRIFIDPTLILDSLQRFRNSLEFVAIDGGRFKISDQIIKNSTIRRFKVLEDKYNVSLGTHQLDINEICEFLTTPNLIEGDLADFCDSIEVLRKNIERFSDYTLVETIGEWQSALRDAHHLYRGNGAWNKEKVKKFVSVITDLSHSKSVAGSLKLSTSLDSRESRLIGILVSKGTKLIEESGEIFESTETDPEQRDIDKKIASASKSANDLARNLKILEKAMS
jgi:hypothetical protein